MINEVQNIRSGNTLFRCSSIPDEHKGGKDFHHLYNLKAKDSCHCLLLYQGTHANEGELNFLFNMEVSKEVGKDEDHLDNDQKLENLENQGR